MPVCRRHINSLLKKKTTKTVILAKWPEDQLYYVVRLVKAHTNEDKYLVVYEDGTESWTPRSNLHIQYCSYRSPYASDDDIICCICENSKSEAPNEIVLCDVCQQGYHQDCCRPKIQGLDEEWWCPTCLYILGEGKLPEIAPEQKSVEQPTSNGDVKVCEPSTITAVSEQATDTTLTLSEAPVKSMDTSTPRKTPLDTSSEMDEPVVQLENGATMEKMQPALINVAKAFVEREKIPIQTKDFVRTVTKDESSTQKVKKFAKAKFLPKIPRRANKERAA